MSEKIQMSSRPSEKPRADDQPKNFDFVLLEHFSGLSLNSAIETLQNANLVAGKTLYTWRLFGTQDGPVASSTGLLQNTSQNIAYDVPGDDIVVVSGENAYDVDTFRLKVWLAKHLRTGVRVTALGTGAIVLARAGLLKGSKAAIHPWYRVGFAEQFEDTQLSPRTHVSNGNRCSASGGTSSIDLFLDFVEQNHGAEFADMTADSMFYRQTKLLQTSVDLSVPNSSSILHPLVSKAVCTMEKNLEFPISPSRLAADQSISTRQLERLFKKYIGQSPKRHYMKLRLEEAYRLLVQTRFEIIQITLMTGFASPSHFSKCFRSQFHITPYDLRKGTL